MKIVIVMPTYNEASNIGVMIDEVFGAVFPALPDKTGDIVRWKMGLYPNLHLLSGERKGLGAAYVRGMTYAMERLGADAVVEMDADFQHDPAHIIDMVSEFGKGADVIVGSRYVEGGSVSPLCGHWRKFGSYLVNRLARKLLGVGEFRDLTSGFRLTRVRGILGEIRLETLMGINRFAYKIDLLYRTLPLSGKRVEIPIRFTERVRERTKFNMWEIMATGKVLLHLWARRACR
jgi:dolichol-phosphate mannosyltransferase